MAFTWLTIVHAVAAVFSIIELGLTGYGTSSFTHVSHVLCEDPWLTYPITVASTYHSSWWYGGQSPSVVNFMIFNSVWSLLVLAYVGITPIYMTSIFHKLVALGLNVVTTIFWFAGSIALAVAVGGPWNCGTNSVCGSLEAAIAFGFFLWYVLDRRSSLDCPLAN
jgi:hypothetical protein